MLLNLTEATIKNQFKTTFVEILDTPSKFPDITKLDGVRIVDWDKSLITLTKEGDGNMVMDIILKHKNGELLTDSRNAIPYQRIFRYDKNTGEFFVERAKLFINPKYQGKGIATGLVEAETSFYKKLGVTRVDIPQAVQDGKIAWAKKSGTEFKYPNLWADRLNTWLVSQNSGGSKWLITKEGKDWYTLAKKNYKLKVINKETSAQNKLLFQKIPPKDYPATFLDLPDWDLNGIYYYYYIK